MLMLRLPVESGSVVLLGPVQADLVYPPEFLEQLLNQTLLFLLLLFLQ